jgi:large subunit ribosomal protein L10
MKRDEKTAVVQEIAAQIGEAEAIWAVDYRGISVVQAAALRSSLREAGASFRVLKNTLTLLAAEKAGAEQVKELIDGPTAFTFVHGDPAQAAKALDSFARQQNVLEVRGGLMEGQLIDADTFRRLARLPGRDQLNAQLAGMVAAPLTGLVRGLNSMLAGLAVALAQVSEKKAKEAPAAETAASKSEEAQPVTEPEASGGEHAGDQEQGQEQASGEEAELDEKEADQ